MTLRQRDSDNSRDGERERGIDNDVDAISNSM